MEEVRLLSLPVLFPSFLFIVLLLRLFKKSKTHNSSLNLPPGPWKLPIIGNLHQLVGSLPHKRLRDLASKYGPLMLLQLGETPHFVVSTPETAKEVLKTHDIIFSERPFLFAADILTYGSVDIAFTRYGDYWRQMKKLCTLELLSVRRVQSFRSIREEEISKLIAYISSNAGNLINVSDLISSLTCTITARVSFGEKCKEQENFILLTQEIMDVLGGFSIADHFPSVKLLQVVSGMLARLKKLHLETDKLMDDIINAHKSRKEQVAKNISEDTSTSIDLVDVLLNLLECNDLNFPLTPDNIKAVILEMFVSGSETSSTTMEWAISEMLKNPRVMKKAKEEVRGVFGLKGFVDESGLCELNYLKLVIKETLRLHPPAPLLLPRECREDCKINGYDIPVESKVIVNAWAIGRDPVYWSEAERFYPERFLDSTVDYRGTNLEFIPFGAGRRMCPGISFSTAIVELLLANYIYHFDWKLSYRMNPEDLDMDEAFGVTVRRKNPLKLIPIPYSSVA